MGSNLTLLQVVDSQQFMPHVEETSGYIKDGSGANAVWRCSWVSRYCLFVWTVALAHMQLTISDIVHSLLQILNINVNAARYNTYSIYSIHCYIIYLYVHFRYYLIHSSSSRSRSIYLLLLLVVLPLLLCCYLCFYQPESQCGTAAIGTSIIYFHGISYHDNFHSTKLGLLRVGCHIIMKMRLKYAGNIYSLQL